MRKKFRLFFNNIFCHSITPIMSDYHVDYKSMLRGNIQSWYYVKFWEEGNSKIFLETNSSVRVYGFERNLSVMIKKEDGIRRHLFLKKDNNIIGDVPLPVSSNQDISNVLYSSMDPYDYNSFFDFIIDSFNIESIYFFIGLFGIIMYILHIMKVRLKLYLFSVVPPLVNTGSGHEEKDSNLRESLNNDTNNVTPKKIWSNPVPKPTIENGRPDWSKVIDWEMNRIGNIRNANDRYRRYAMDFLEHINEEIKRDPDYGKGWQRVPNIENFLYKKCENWGINPNDITWGLSVNRARIMFRHRDFYFDWNTQTVELREPRTFIHTVDEIRGSEVATNYECERSRWLKENGYILPNTNNWREIYKLESNSNVDVTTNNINNKVNNNNNNNSNTLYSIKGEFDRDFLFLDWIIDNFNIEIIYILIGILGVSLYIILTIKRKFLYNYYKSVLPALWTMNSKNSTYESVNSKEVEEQKKFLGSIEDSVWKNPVPCPENIDGVDNWEETKKWELWRIQKVRGAPSKYKEEVIKFLDEINEKIKTSLPCYGKGDLNTDIEYFLWWNCRKSSMNPNDFYLTQTLSYKYKYYHKDFYFNLTTRSIELREPRTYVHPCDKMVVDKIAPAHECELSRYFETKNLTTLPNIEDWKGKYYITENVNKLIKKKRKISEITSENSNTRYNLRSNTQRMDSSNSINTNKSNNEELNNFIMHSVEDEFSINIFWIDWIIDNFNIEVIYVLIGIFGISMYIFHSIRDRLNIFYYFAIPSALPNNTNNSIKGEIQEIKTYDLNDNFHDKFLSNPFFCPTKGSCLYVWKNPVPGYLNGEVSWDKVIKFEMDRIEALRSASRGYKGYSLYFIKYLNKEVILNYGENGGCKYNIEKFLWENCYRWGINPNDIYILDKGRFRHKNFYYSKDMDYIFNRQLDISSNFGSQVDLERVKFAYQCQKGLKKME